MKEIRVTILALLMSLIVSFSFAQIQRKGAIKKDSAQSTQQEMVAENELGAKAKNKQMLQSLNLSKEQRQKLKSLRRENKEKKAAIENNEGLTAEEKQQHLKLLHKAATDNMKSVLSDEQKTKMKAMRQEKKQQKGNSENGKQNDTLHQSVLQNK